MCQFLIVEWLRDAHASLSSIEGERMAGMLALVLVVLWLLGFSTADAFGGRIHLLLGAALVVFALGASRARGHKGTV